MEIRKFNYFGFVDSAVKKKFGDQLEFVCEMPVPLKTSYGMIHTPCAVYFNPTPDRMKNHKDYMLLFSAGDTYFVSGRDEKEMQWNIPAILCHACDQVLVSIDRHHFMQCACENETFVDGGMSYQRIGGKDLSQISNVIVNMRTGEIKLTR